MNVRLIKCKELPEYYTAFYGNRFPVNWSASVKTYVRQIEDALETEEWTEDKILELAFSGKYAIFPVTETIRAESVQNYYRLGLAPIFVRASDFRKLKKKCME